MPTARSSTQPTPVFWKPLCLIAGLLMGADTAAAPPTAFGQWSVDANGVISTSDPLTVISNEVRDENFLQRMVQGPGGVYVQQIALDNLNGGTGFASVDQSSETFLKLHGTGIAAEQGMRCLGACLLTDGDPYTYNGRQVILTGALQAPDEARVYIHQEKTDGALGNFETITDITVGDYRLNGEDLGDFTHVTFAQTYLGPIYDTFWSYYARDVTPDDLDVTAARLFDAGFIGSATDTAAAQDYLHRYVDFKIVESFGTRRTDQGLAMQDSLIQLWSGAAVKRGKAVYDQTGVEVLWEDGDKIFQYQTNYKLDGFPPFGHHEVANREPGAPDPFGGDIQLVFDSKYNLREWGPLMTLYTYDPGLGDYTTADQPFNSGDDPFDPLQPFPQ